MDALRVVIIILGSTCFLVMVSLFALQLQRVSRVTSLSTLGGATVCLAVALGT